MSQVKGNTIKNILYFFTLCAWMLFPLTNVFAVPTTDGIQVYQENVHLSPEHTQKIADALDRYRSADNIWDILREEFSLAHYENNPAVESKIQWYMNNQDFLLRSATRAAPYLYYILQEVKKRDLPVELVLLPIVESGYNPFSLSNVGAAGIWQLMPKTATGLGLRQDWSYDGRRDIIASTRGALNHLAYLQSFFDGNWLLAIAAYNTGEGNVLSAIRRNIREGEDTEFWALPLSQQTRDYVPSLLALAIIISHPEQYPIYFPPVRNAPYLAQVDVSRSINLKHAASLAGITHEKILQLNPGFSRSDISANMPHKLILPIENVSHFSENLARTFILPKAVDWLHYKVKTGDTIFSIARKFNSTPSEISHMNHLARFNAIHKGTNLLIPNHEKKTILNDSDDELIFAENANSPTSQIRKVAHKPIITSKIFEKIKVAQHATTTKKYTLQAGDTIYLVRKKDTLQSIAKRFHVSKTLLQKANHLPSHRLAIGKPLLIPTHSAAKTFAKASSHHVKKNITSGDTIYMVRKGDTIQKIAKRFKTTPSAIRVANLSSAKRLIVGESLVIPTHLKG